MVGLMTDDRRTAQPTEPLDTRIPCPFCGVKGCIGFGCLPEPTEPPQYWKGTFNSRLGLAIMRQMDAESNAQMIVMIYLPEDEAQAVADKFVAILEDSHDQ